MPTPASTAATGSGSGGDNDDMAAIEPCSLPTVRGGDELRAQVRAWRSRGLSVALVPTMGALHEGHRSLIRLARREADRVVASLFVNPAQFGPGEDFLAYPRDESTDAASLAASGCDLLFAPTAGEIYPVGFATRVVVDGPARELEGAARPAHFAGVATVVAKLLILCAPDAAVFGEKDYQQLVVIKRVVRDLGLPVRVLAAPTVREADGLALSSRNAYLTAAQRLVAPALHEVLSAVTGEIRGGAPVPQAEARAEKRLLAAGFDAVDYVSTRTAATLEKPPADAPAGGLRVLAAARLGATRLLDNLPV